ncbi:hypothetical protein GmHk_16G046430 [Glycine max]|nr:hypothetical protein GmHk_16G046430 [Glycine max]
MLDASAGEKIFLNTPKKAIEIIEKMATNAKKILSDRAMVPLKRLLEVSTQDGLLAQQKLLTRKIEELTQQNNNFLNNSSFKQLLQTINSNNNQGYKPYGSIGQEQGSSSNAMPRHNLYEKTRKLEETLTQFMQVSLSIRKSIEASIKV